MSEDSEQNQLAPQNVDYATEALKALLRASPFVGSLLAEISGLAIPNQQIDRIVKFAEVLEQKLSNIQQDFIQSELSNGNFSDLLNEGMRQAALSLSDERREYIANLIANSLSDQDVEYIEAKHLLRILGEIDDIEIFWLRVFIVPTIGGDEVSREKHSGLIKPTVASLADSQSIYDKRAFQGNYKEHLTQLGLLKAKHRTDMKTRTPRFEAITGALEISGYQLSQFGRLLLRYIGLSEPIN